MNDEVKVWVQTESDGSSRVVLSLPDSLGTRRLSSILDLTLHPAKICHDLAVFAELLSDAYRILEDGVVADTRDDRITLSKAFRLHSVMADDGADLFIARKLAKKNGDHDIPPHAQQAYLRAYLFQTVSGMWESISLFLPYLIFVPQVFGVSSEHVTPLREALDEMAEVSIRERISTEPRSGTIAEFQSAFRRYAQECRRMLEYLGEGVRDQTFGGDPDNLVAILGVLPKLASAMETLVESTMTPTCSGSGE